MLTIELTIPGDEQPVSVTLLSLTRSDTGDPVAGVSLPDDFSDAGDGQWIYTFSPPAAGLHYDYTFRLTWSDGTYNDGGGSLTDAVEGERAAGEWLDEDFLDAYIGDANHDFYADKDNAESAAAMLAAKQQAIKMAEDQARRMLARRYVIPLSPLSDDDLFTLRRLTAPIAVYELWRARGQLQGQNMSPYMKHPFQKARDDALAELEAISGPDAHLSLGAKEIEGWGTPAVGVTTFIPVAGHSRMRTELG